MSEETVQIEKGSVQETLIIPLYGRKLCTERFPHLFSDERAVELCNRLNPDSTVGSMAKLSYDFSDLEQQGASFFYEFGALEGAMRGLDMQWEVNDYLREHPAAAVVNLGCGLDQTGEVCSNGTCTIYNVDMPDVIAVREQLLGDLDSINIASDLTDHAWIDQIDGAGGAVFFAAGVFHYLSFDQARELTCALAKRFPGGRLVFDSVGKLGQRMMLRVVLRNTDMDKLDDLLYVSGPEDIASWSDKLRVSARGYMLGYCDLDDPAISGKHRFLARIADKVMKMQIYRIEFE